MAFLGATVPSVTKQQRLRNAAEGFMAGLVANGYVGPFKHSHLNWELPFYRAWAQWEPARETQPNSHRSRSAGTAGPARPGKCCGS